MNKNIIMVIGLMLLLVPLSASLTIECGSISCRILAPEPDFFVLSSNPRQKITRSFEPPETKAVPAKSAVINLATNQVVIPGSNFIFKSSKNDVRVTFLVDYGQDLPTGKYQIDVAGTSDAATGTNSGKFIIDVTPPTLDDFQALEDGIEKATNTNDQTSFGENTQIAIKIKARDFDGGATDFIPQTTLKDIAWEVNGETLQPTAPGDGFFTFTYPATAGDPSLALGAYTSFIVLNDNLGNNIRIPFTFEVVDVTPPTVTLKSPRGGFTIQSTPTIVLETSEASTCVFERKATGVTEPLSTLGLTHTFSNVQIDTPSGDAQDNVISTFKATCTDTSGNKQAQEIAIAFRTKIPTITGLTSTRGSPINSFVQGRITSLRAATNTVAECFYKGGKTPIADPTAAEIIQSMGPAGKIHEVDLTDQIKSTENGILNANYKFFVICKETGTNIPTIQKSTEFLVNLRLQFLKLEPQGTIADNTPHLNIELTVPAFCRSQGSLVSFSESIKQSHTIQAPNAPLADTINRFPIECSKNPGYPADPSITIPGTITFTVDTLTPPPTIDTIKDSTNQPIRGNVARSTTLTMSGIAEPGAAVTIKATKATIEVATATTIATDGTYTLSIFLPAEDGKYTVQATAKDPFQNTAAGTSQDITLDQSGPARPTLAALPAETNIPEITIAGFLDEINAEAQIALEQLGKTPKTRTVPGTNEPSIRMGTSALLRSLRDGGNYVKSDATIRLPQSSADLVQIGNYLKFSNHQLPQFGQYEITGKLVEDFPPATFLQLSPVLQEDVSAFDTVEIVSSKYPEGHFTASFVLFEESNLLTVRGVDSLLNAGPPARATIILDTVKPTITSTTPSLTSNTQTLVTAQLSGTGTPIDESSIVMNIQGPCQISNLRTPEINGLHFLNNQLLFKNSEAKLCGGLDTFKTGTYTVSISANDKAGNPSDASPFTFTINTDFPDEPTFTITSGIRESNSKWFVKQDAPQVAMRFLESEIQLSDTTLDNLPSPPPQPAGNSKNTFTFPSRKLTEGSHVFRTTAKKKIGSNFGKGQAFALELIIDTKKPTLTLTSEPIAAQKEITLQLSYDDANIKTIALTGDIEKSIDVKSQATPNQVTAIKVNLTGSDGTKQITLSAEDAAGNTQTALLTISLDTEASTVQLQFVDPSGQVIQKTGDEFITDSSSFIVNCRCSDQLAGCDPTKTAISSKELPNGNPSPVQNNEITTSGAGDQSVNVTCTTQDNAGNPAAASAVVKIDRTAPTITLKNPSHATTNKQVNDITIETDDLSSCEFSLRPDLLATSIKQMASEDQMSHVQRVDFAFQDAKWDDNNPKIFTYFARCTNAFGKKSPITNLAITADTTELTITDVSSSKPLFYVDNFANAITIRTNKEAICRYGDNVDGNFQSLPLPITGEYSTVHTIQKEFSNGKHELAINCQDKSDNTLPISKSFSFELNVNQAFRFVEFGPTGRIADNTPDLFAKLNKRGSCTFNDQPATGRHDALESNRFIDVQFSNSTSTQPDGPQDVEIECKDASSFRIRIKYQYIIDTTPPNKPTILQPITDAKLQQEVAIKGTTQSGVDHVNILVNNQKQKTVTLTSQDYESTIDLAALPDGPITLAVEAVFPNGEEFKSEQATVIITKDTTSQAPTLNPIDPVVTQSRATITGLGEPLATIELTRSPAKQGASIQTVEAATDAAGVFEAKLPLEEGLNTISATQVDLLQNPKSSTSNILRTFLDRAPPEIKIIKPTESINNLEVDIEIRLEDKVKLDEVTLEINTSPKSIINIQKARLQSNKVTIKEKVSITENGFFRLNVSAKDKFGNSNSAERLFILDTSLPDAAEFNLKDKVVSTSRPTLVFSFTEPVTVKELAGITHDAPSTQDNKVFTYTTNNLDEIQHKIYIVAESLPGTGIDGNFSFNFTVDLTPPALAITKAPTKSIIDTIIIAGTCTDNLALGQDIEITVEQGGLADKTDCADDNFTSQFSLIGGDGEKTIKITATDAAGNKNTSFPVVDLDTIPPAITITSVKAPNPLTKPYRTNLSSITIVGKVIESNPKLLQVLTNNDPITISSIATSPNGDFTISLPLVGSKGQDTLNNLTFVATDSFGQSVNRSILVQKDLQGPQLDRISPLTGSAPTPRPTIQVRLNEEATSCLLHYPTHSTSGTKTESMTKKDSTTYKVQPSAEIRHIPGGTKTQSIILDCYDIFGNRASTILPFIIDLKNPIITAVDIDYFGRILASETEERSSFVITSVPAGAALRLTATTAETTICVYNDSNSLTPFESSELSADQSLSRELITDVSALNLFNPPLSNPATQVKFPSTAFSRTHRTSPIPIVDQTNYTFNVSCIDQAQRNSNIREIKLEVDTQLEVTAPVITVDSPSAEVTSTAASVFTEDPEFKGSILSFTPGVDITEAKLEIGGKTFTLALNNKGLFNQTVSGLEDGFYSYVLRAKNSEGIETIKQGTIKIDTKGPGGCITVGSQKACSSSVPVQEATSSSTTSHQVTMQEFTFLPNQLTISKGDTLVWTNKDNAPHTVTATDGSFTSGALTKDQTYSRTFNTPGTYAYGCQFHPSMGGTIIVSPTQTTTPSTLTCGDNICSVAENCPADCLITAPELGFVQSTHGSFDGKFLSIASYFQNEVIFTAHIYAQSNKAELDAFFEEQRKGLFVNQKIIRGGKAIYTDGKIAIWKSTKNNIHYLIALLAPLSFDNIPLTLIDEYLLKYPSNSN